MFRMDKYNTSEEPPAPFVKVKIANPQTGKYEEEVGKIDTGAYKTAFPEKWVTKLNLVPVSEERMKGYKKGEQKHNTYFVNVTLKGYNFPYTEAVAIDRKNILIGRDILNQLKLILDGKNLKFEILDP